MSLHIMPPSFLKMRVVKGNPKEEACKACLQRLVAVHICEVLCNLMVGRASDPTVVEVVASVHLKSPQARS